MRRFLLLAALTSTTALAGERVLIAPVHGNDVVPADLVVEVEEAVRSGVMRRARELDLLVMSHATLERSLDDLRLSGRDKALGLPCETAACDARLGRALGTGVTVSTTLTKVDEPPLAGDAPSTKRTKYVAVVSVTSTGTNSDDVLSSSTATATTFGALLSQVQLTSETLWNKPAAAPVVATPTAPPAPVPVVEERTLRKGFLAITRDGEMLGDAYDCSLTTTNLRCVSVGLFASGQRLLIPLAAVTSVFPDNGQLGLSTARTNYTISLMKMTMSNDKATPREKEAERLRLTIELAAWRTDLDDAVKQARP